MHTNIYAVIHVKDYDQGMTNAVLADQCGCDGVFFINHGTGKDSTLVKLAEDFGPEKSGINFLSLSPKEALENCGKSASMLWSDTYPQGLVAQKNFLDYKIGHNQCKTMFFGGVAFKYQLQPVDLKAELQSVIGLIDIITTSGPATGVPPSVEKLITINEVFKDRRKVAVASGITSENVTPMLPYVGNLLVATGIGKDFYNIDKDKCLELVDVVRS